MLKRSAPGVKEYKCLIILLFSRAVYLLSQTSSALKEREQRMALAVCALVKERTENNGASLTTSLIEPALGKF